MQEQELCDSLVYQYLIENGHHKTAQLLQEERKIFYSLNFKEDMKISESFSYMISEYVKTDAMSNTLVYDYFKSHENCEIRKMAQELQGLVHIQTNENYPSFSEVINHFLTPHKILKPKELLRQVHISQIRKYSLAEKAKTKAEEMAKSKAEEVTKNKAEDKAQKEAEEIAKNEAAAKAKKAVNAISGVGSILRKGMKFKSPEEYSIFMMIWKKHEADLKAKNEADEAEEMATKKAAMKAKRAITWRVISMEIEVKKEAELKVKNEAEEMASKKAEIKAKKEMVIKAKHEAKLMAKKLAEERAMKKAEMKAKKEVEEKAKYDAELKAKNEAEEVVKKKVQMKANLGVRVKNCEWIETDSENEDTIVVNNEPERNHQNFIECNSSVTKSYVPFTMKKGFLFPKPEWIETDSETENQDISVKGTFVMKKGFIFPKPVPSVISIVKKEPCDINHNAVVRSEPVDFDFRPQYID